MGNLAGCGLFNDRRSMAERMWVDGLTEEENSLLKEVYSNMAIARTP